MIELLDRVVTRISSSVLFVHLMKRAAWDAYGGGAASRAICVARSPLVFYDAGWVDAEDPPKWYMANHSTEAANMRMGVLDPSVAPRR